MSEASPAARWGMRGIALTYLSALLIIPVLVIFFRTFEHGLGPPIEAITSSEGLHAFWLTLICVGIAVPLNTLFGTITALVLVRQEFRGKALLNSAIDLPFAVSPVVIGLSLFLVYGPRDGWVGGWLADNGIQVIFSVPGMVLATIFVSLPFVVREVMPVLQEIGTDQEEAAETLGASPWQTFWRVTLPAIRWGLAYGVVLATARALGEFGAVSVVSGRISGKTQTLPLYVQKEFENFNLAGAYAAAIVLAIIALLVLFGMSRLQRRSSESADADEESGGGMPGPGVFVPQPVTGGSSASPPGPPRI
jgi:sulfate/thiosulfate transport system permease protein